MPSTNAIARGFAGDSQLSLPFNITKRQLKSHPPPIAGISPFVIAAGRFIPLYHTVNTPIVTLSLPQRRQQYWLR